MCHIYKVIHQTKRESVLEEIFVNILYALHLLGIE